MDVDLYLILLDFKIAEVNVVKTEPSTYTQSTAIPGGQGAYPVITVTINNYIITFIDIDGLKYESFISDKIRPKPGPNGFVHQEEFDGVIPSREEILKTLKNSITIERKEELLKRRKEEEEERKEEERKEEEEKERILSLIEDHYKGIIISIYLIPRRNFSIQILGKKAEWIEATILDKAVNGEKYYYLLEIKNCGYSIYDTKEAVDRPYFKLWVDLKEISWNINNIDEQIADIRNNSQNKMVMELKKLNKNVEDLIKKRINDKLGNRRSNKSNHKSNRRSNKI